MNGKQSVVAVLGVVGILFGLVGANAAHAMAPARNAQTQPLSAALHANPQGTGCPSILDGGEIPIPFSETNTKVELAHGEIYTLVGTIEIMDGVAYFAVDLNQHPWLANLQRVNDPRYPLQGTLDSWMPYNGKVVRLSARALAGITAQGQISIHLAALTDSGGGSMQSSANGNGRMCIARSR